MSEQINMIDRSVDFYLKAGEDMEEVARWLAAALRRVVRDGVGIVEEEREIKRLLKVTKNLA